MLKKSLWLLCPLALSLCMTGCNPSEPAKTEPAKTENSAPANTDGTEPAKTDNAGTTANQGELVLVSLDVPNMT